MSAEGDSLMRELEQSRAFDVMERNERIENAKSLTETNRAAARLNEGVAELNRAKARFWRTLAVWVGIATSFLIAAGFDKWILR